MKNTKKIIGTGLLILLFSGISYGVSIRRTNISKIINEARNSAKRSSDGGAGTSVKSGANFSLNGASQNKTVTLNGGRADIQGASNTVTIKGKASVISIQGADNTVYVDSVEKVIIQGADNRVIYKTSPTKSGRPVTSITGADSSVSKR